MILLLAVGSFATAVERSVFAFSLAFSSLSSSLLASGKARPESLVLAYSASTLLFPVFFIAVPPVFSAFRKIAPLALAGLCLLVIIRSGNAASSSAVLLCSGALGLVTLGTGICENPLTALFGGFFGLFASAETPEEKTPLAREGGIYRSAALSAFVSMALVMIPAATPFLAQPVTALAFQNAQQAYGSMVISKAFFDIVSFFAIGKARSVAAAELEVAGAGGKELFVGVAAGFSSLACACYFCKKAQKIGGDHAKKISIASKAAIIAIVAATCGLAGLAVCFAAACISAFARANGVGEGTCLGCIYVPSMAYSAGLAAPLISFVLA